MTNGGSWAAASPDLLQRAAHLAVLRILVDERRDELDRLGRAAEALSRTGFTLDRTDPLARLSFVRSTRQLSERVAAATVECRAAEAALREAVLDDRWTPSDDLSWPDSAR